MANKQRLRATVLPALAMAVFVWRAWPSLWTTVDDAWISARFAAQFAAGNGLVFNAGEPPIEGYTNLIWTLWLALGEGLGVDLLPWMVGSGLLAGAGTVAAVAALTHGLQGKHGPWWAPGVASMVVALDVHHAVASTNGLETGLFVFASTALGALACRVRGRGLWLLGAGLALLAAIRPEGLIVGGMLTLVAWQSPERRASPRDLVGMWTCLGVGWLALEGWRLATYGAWLPNTFAAKASGGLGMHIQRNLRHLSGDGSWWIAAAVVLLVALALGFRDTRKWAIGAMAILCVGVAFRVPLWMPAGRLLLPATVWTVCLAGAAAHSRAGKGLLGAVVAGSLLAPFTSIETHVRKADVRHSVQLPNGASEAAAHLAEHLPEGAWLAVRDAGVFAHFVGTGVNIAELHHRALTQLHPDGADTDIASFTPEDPEVIVLTQARKKTDAVRYAGDRRVFYGTRRRYTYLGRVYQHYHRYYDVYVLEGLVPPLPEHLVTNRLGPKPPNRRR